MARPAHSEHRLHKEIARDAGFGSLSVLSVLAGVVCAYGTFAVVAAVAGAVTDALGITADFRTDDWTSNATGAAAVTAVVLFVAYLFGGYVAGRMARRAAVLHGLAVFVTSLVLGAIAGGLVTALADNADIEQNLRSIGIPTTTDQVNEVAIAGALVSLAAILLGSLLGSWLGERWHSKLARRAVDPAYGPQADAWDRAAAAEYDAHRRAERDRALQAITPAGDRDGHDDLDLRDRPVVAGGEADRPRYTAEEWAARQRSGTRPF